MFLNALTLWDEISRDTDRHTALELGADVDEGLAEGEEPAEGD